MQTEDLSHEMESLQVVMFDLADEIYGIGLDMVQEVIRLSEITTVPQTPDFIEGVINLRGYFIPVVDMKRRFGLGEVADTKSARIMIVEVRDNIIGIAVDRVLEVTTIAADAIEPPSPLIRTSIKSDYLVGFSEFNGEMIKILDFDKVFTLEEFAGLDGIEDKL